MADPVLGDPDDAGVGHDHTAAARSTSCRTRAWWSWTCARCPRRHHSDGFVDEITARLRRACPRSGGRASAQPSRRWRPTPDHPCIRAAGKGGRAVRGRAVVLRRQPAGKSGGIPAVAAGPGDIAQAHTADEWVDENDLREGVEFYKRASPAGGMTGGRAGCAKRCLFPVPFRVNTQDMERSSWPLFAPNAFFLLRLVSGLMFACHGAQKVLGMFPDPTHHMSGPLPPMMLMRWDGLNWSADFWSRLAYLAVTRRLFAAGRWRSPISWCTRRGDSFPS